MQKSFRPARVFAMQLLYAMEITGQTVGEALPGVLEGQPIDDEQKKYVDILMCNSLYFYIRYDLLWTYRNMRNT